MPAPAPLPLSVLDTQVRQLLADQRVGNFEYSEAIVLKAINWACQDICRHLGLSYAESTPLTPSSGQVILPVTVIKVIRVYGASMLNLLTKTETLLEDQKNPAWRNMASPATSWMDYTGGSILLNGTVAGNQVVVGYIERPTQMAVGTDLPDSRLPDYYHPLLKYFAASYLLSLAGPSKDMSKAKEFYANGLDLIAKGEQGVASPVVDR